MTDGMREGINKEEILKDLTEDDWKRIKDMKQAEELKLNKYAYQFFVESEQGVLSMLQLKWSIEKGINALRRIKQRIREYSVDIAKGSTDRTFDNDGRKMTVEDIAIDKERLEQMVEEAVTMIKGELARMYRFVGMKRLNKEVLINEENYNTFVQEIIGKLRSIDIDIYPESG